jgi:hypothetical protein
MPSGYDCAYVEVSGAPGDCFAGPVDAVGFGAYGVIFVTDALVGWAAQGIHSTRE